MKQPQMNRRSVLKAGAGLAGLAALGLPASAFAQERRLRMYWWGSKERADRTLLANKLYQQTFTGVAIDGETLAWGDYWPRLATQTAGRNAPDVIQMDYRYIFEYARRGALLPLDQFLGTALNLKDFPGSVVDSGKVDGKIYGVSLGGNSSTMLYDKQAFEAAGIAPPSMDTDWSSFAKSMADLTKAAKKEGYFGTADGGGLEPLLEGWLRTRGQELYTPDGKLGFGEKDIGEWFAFWADMRAAGACVTPDMQALDKLNPESSMITLGKAALAYAHSNQLVAYQSLNKAKLAMTSFPTGGASGKPAHYIKPSMMFSVSARTKEPEEAARIINFYVNDITANKILGVERGVPAAAPVLASINDALDEQGRAMADYIAKLTPRVGALPPPPPPGAGEIQFLIRRVNEQVGFDRLKVADAAKLFVTEASRILSRG